MTHTLNIYSIARKHLKSGLKAMILAGCISFFAPEATAQMGVAEVDTTLVTKILIDEAREANPGKVTRIARLFVGVPYAAGTLEVAPEHLIARMDSMDCTTFVENVAALAITAREHRESWQDFLYNLERLRYRDGRIDGYGSRLHYVSDWILNNQSRGLLKEVTADMNNARYQVKSLDYMSEHRDAYPALADSLNYAAIRSTESGFSNHRYPFVKGHSCSAKNLKEFIRDGDIIAFTTSEKGLDVSHLGIAMIDPESGEIRFFHASSAQGCVVLDELPLANYIRRHRNEGIRVIRIAE